MNFSCSICCNRFESSDKIFSTSCGHVFHFTCLSEWLIRSDTCPECRIRTSSTKILRLYFNTSNNDTIREDSEALHERIENLELQVISRNTNIEYLKKKSERHEKKIVELEITLSDWENQVRNKNSFIHILEEHVKYYEREYIDGQKYQEQAKGLETKLNNLQDLQTILESSNEEADEIISTTNDPRDLAVYVSALKCQLTTESKKHREYKTKIEGLKCMLDVKTEKIHELKKKLKKNPSREEAMLLENQNRKMKRMGEDCIGSQKKIAATSSGTLNSNNIFHDYKSNDENKENYLPLNMQLDRGKVSGKSTSAKKPRPTRDPTSTPKLRDKRRGSDSLEDFILGLRENSNN